MALTPSRILTYRRSRQAQSAALRLRAREKAAAADRDAADARLWHWRSVGSLDGDELDEALYNATGSGRWAIMRGTEQTPPPGQVATFRCSLVTFLEQMPEDVTAFELLGLLNHARADRTTRATKNRLEA